MTKNVVITSRGKKLDLTALKAANPNVKPVGGRVKRVDAPSAELKKPIRIRTPRLNAVTAAPLPVPTVQVSEPSPVVLPSTEKKIKNHKVEGTIILDYYSEQPKGK